MAILIEIKCHYGIFAVILSEKIKIGHSPYFDFF